MYLTNSDLLSNGVINGVFNFIHHFKATFWPCEHHLMDIKVLHSSGLFIRDLAATKTCFVSYILQYPLSYNLFMLVAPAGNSSIFLSHK